MKWFYHSGGVGDSIYSLPAMIAMGGGGFCSQPQMQHYVKSLFDLQPYIKKTRFYMCYARFKFEEFGPELFIEGEGPFVNLDIFRNIEHAAYLKKEYMHIAAAALKAFNVEYDLTNPWLFNIKPKAVAPIIVNRTKRYHCGDQSLKVDWSVLKKYSEHVCYIGKGDQYETLSALLGFKPKFYTLDKKNIALDFAKVIMGSKLFIGNQSFGFSLAEGLKKPRVLDMWPARPNCVPNGIDGYTQLTGEIVERYL